METACCLVYCVIALLHLQIDAVRAAGVPRASGDCVFFSQISRGASRDSISDDVDVLKMV